ncbi:hypothetical protein RJ639_037796 [Escallonia herrerae]|uniref:Uncharacterized protein n=1 Tax=Escallonia herrerae TaxID=1293975 RepID=A0AA89B3P6_9ASTE|nr:hypothetical protein RJ639_037796 [Escallonia herrerae]
MSTQKQVVTARDLVEEGKKRIVFLIVCVVGLSYLMSYQRRKAALTDVRGRRVLVIVNEKISEVMTSPDIVILIQAEWKVLLLLGKKVLIEALAQVTSSSVWVNLPAAALLITILRYLSLDFDLRRKAAAYNSKPSSANISSQRKHLEVTKDFIQKSDWRKKVNSPVVEEAIDHFTRHLVSEWVTDLWYSRITPDKQGPEELVQIINGVLGEASRRMRSINLIDLLTRDIINLICTHLELFRASQAKIQKQQLGLLTTEQQDLELKSVLAAENKLHPALFSAEAEHKVLQHLMDGLISCTFEPEDLHCSLFRYIVRELLACAVIRPVLNLASPKFINERIESLVISLSKADKGATTAQVASASKPNGSTKISSDHFSRFLDPSVKGVELVQLKKDQSNFSREDSTSDNGKGMLLSKDPLLSIDTRSTRSWSSLPSDSQNNDGGGIQRHRSGGEWGDMLDLVSRRKTEVLAPEHFENMWAKGRNYKKKEGANSLTVQQSASAGSSKTVDHSKALSKHREKVGASKGTFHGNSAGCTERPAAENLLPHNNFSTSSHPQLISSEDDDQNLEFDGVESGSSSSYPTDEETNNITGLDSPGIKVWDGKSNRNLSVSRIHHPLESSGGQKTRKTCKGRVQSQRLPRTPSSRKRSRLDSQKLHVWQEVERTTFLSGDGQDILHFSKGDIKSEESSGDSEAELLGRTRSGGTASSSVSSLSLPESHSLAVNGPKISQLGDSFLKLRLRCEVLGANIVRSGSRTFAVYSISVTDVDNSSWSIKRRFRHFAELHRRLKEFPEYNLQLPPKHFLSTGLDMPVIQERCQLLDIYLKKLLQLPTVSGSIEVWDFLSVDSQTYSFSNSISIVETLPVDLNNTACEKNKEVCNMVGPAMDPMFSRREILNDKEAASMVKSNAVADMSRLNTKSVALSPQKTPAKEPRKPIEDSRSDSDSALQKHTNPNKKLGKTVKGGGGDDLHASSEPLINAAIDSTLPTELQDGGWIRRKAFWVAKQVLQLGMGDALDDWLIEKIQLLRRGSVVASGINRVEQILWPDGYFITKHPKRQRPRSSVSPYNSPHGQPPTPLSSANDDSIWKLEELQQKEAQRRAKFVYELMIDNAPAAIVGLVGRKEYEQCAKDLYYFLQSSVCLKQLAFDLLELLLLSAFPELDYVFREVHDQKEKFGKLERN